MNSWEQSYFDVNHETVLRMAGEARDIGADMVVVDDGWFVNRGSDSTGLGDWRADPVKFPEGLGPLVRRVNDMGIKFGLWLEPEMISKQSELNHKHPEWWLSEPGRRSQVSRNQMVLDLSRREVQDYLFETISMVLREANISYIKVSSNP
jgi:alpha-galactosidase